MCLCCASRVWRGRVVRQQLWAVSLHSRVGTGQQRGGGINSKCFLTPRAGEDESCWVRLQPSVESARARRNLVQTVSLIAQAGGRCGEAPFLSVS